MPKAERHKLSEIWGNMPPDQFAELVEDIRVHGCKEPVVLLNGEVLDGWHRANACQKAGLKIPIRQFDPATDGTPREFVDRRNAHRRHQTAVQRAAGLVLSKKWDEENGATSVPTLKEIAEETGLSLRTVGDISTGVQGGFGQEMVNGQTAPHVAAEKVRAKRAPQPAKPPKIRPPSKDQARIIELELEVADLKEKNAILAAEAQSKVDITLDEEEAAKKWQNVYRQIDALESQRDEWMLKSNAWQKECDRLRRKYGDR